MDDDDDNGHQGSVRPDQTSQDKKRQKQNKGKDRAKTNTKTRMRIAMHTKEVLVGCQA